MFYRHTAALIAALIFGLTSAAHATNWPGNNGGGNGGCGVGQQTNGCGQTGPQGPAGPAGPQGPQGPKGDTGAQGPKGDTGATGAQGPKGDKGDPGVAGKDGKDGTNGLNGKDGAAGAAGSNGKDGATGAAGSDGKDGAQGTAGATGATGATGAAGKDAPQDAVTAPQLASAVSTLNARIDTVERNAYAGTAGAIAAASIPQAPEPGTKIIGAGVGAYRGQAALAVGMSWRSDSGKWISKASLSADTRGGLGVGAGVAYVWK